MFAHIAGEYGVTAADLARWLTPPFIEFSSNSRSGEMFWLSQDKRVLIKTISRREVLQILILPEWHATLSHSCRAAGKPFFVFCLGIARCLGCVRYCVL